MLASPYIRTTKTTRIISLCQDTSNPLCNISTNPYPPDVRTHRSHTKRKITTPKNNIEKIPTQQNNKWERKEIHTASQRDSYIPHTRCWHHSPNTSQSHHVTTIQTYGKNHEKNTTTSWLHFHTRRRCPHIFTQPDETSHTQRRRIPQLTRWTQLGRRQLFLSNNTVFSQKNGAILTIT